MTIGKAIKTLREKKGMSVHEVATRSGISDSHLYNIEADLRLPTQPVKESVASILGIPVVILDISIMDFKQMGVKSGWDKQTFYKLKSILETEAHNFLVNNNLL